jgi:putative transposase
VTANQEKYSVAMICRVLKISRSGYYAWLGRAPSHRAKANETLTETIRELHQRSRGIYGSPRIHADLVDLEIFVGRKRVARLMRLDGIRGVCRRKRYKTTVRSARPSAPDLVRRKFVAERPDQLWVADITYVPTWTGTLYLATIIDVWSRKVVGWSMATHMRKELVIDALRMAIAQRQPTELVHHSDHGSQYTSLAFGKRCKDYGIQVSMGSVGDCYDNALAESFFASLECEMIDRTTLKSPAQARVEVFDYLEGFYNPYRRHSGLGQMSPANFERRFRATSVA